MESARFLSHMNHVSISPTDATRPTFVLHGQRLYKRNLSLYLYMFIAVTLTSSVPTACSRLTLWLSR